MIADTSSKVNSSHLARTAYLYVRQSTLRQVINNTESATRQYALRQRAIALGWPAEQIVVIDTDQGHSGASAADREGFQRLVAEVGMGRAGIVLGLEVSRLARNNADWHRLLEICALSGTLICDEDGLYDPADFNDRLLLGLKGTMSEALCRHRHRASTGSPRLSRAPWNLSGDPPPRLCHEAGSGLNTNRTETEDHRPCQRCTPRRRPRRERAQPGRSRGSRSCPGLAWSTSTTRSSPAPSPSAWPAR